MSPLFVAHNSVPGVLWDARLKKDDEDMKRRLEIRGTLSIWGSPHIRPGGALKKCESIASGA
jgi:hypothetical protein